MCYFFETRCITAVKIRRTQLKVYFQLSALIESNELCALYDVTSSVHLYDYISLHIKIKLKDSVTIFKKKTMPKRTNLQCITVSAVHHCLQIQFRQHHWLVQAAHRHSRIWKYITMQYPRHHCHQHYSLLVRPEAITVLFLH